MSKNRFKENSKDITGPKKEPVNRFKENSTSTIGPKPNAPMNRFKQNAADITGNKAPTVKPPENLPQT